MLSHLNPGHWYIEYLTAVITDMGSQTQVSPAFTFPFYGMDYFKTRFVHHLKGLPTVPWLPALFFARWLLVVLDRFFLKPVSRWWLMAVCTVFMAPFQKLCQLMPQTGKFRLKLVVFFFRNQYVPRRYLHLYYSGCKHKNNYAENYHVMKT